jgi:hypothetical protein
MQKKTLTLKTLMLMLVIKKRQLQQIINNAMKASKKKLIKIGLIISTIEAKSNVRNMNNITNKYAIEATLKKMKISVKQENING